MLTIHARTTHLFQVNKDRQWSNYILFFVMNVLFTSNSNKMSLISKYGASVPCKLQDYCIALYCIALHCICIIFDIDERVHQENYKLLKIVSQIKIFCVFYRHHCWI